MTIIITLPATDKQPYKRINDNYDNYDNNNNSSNPQTNNKKNTSVDKKRDWLPGHGSPDSQSG